MILCLSRSWRAARSPFKPEFNSQGIVIPKPVLVQLGLNAEAGAEMTVEGDALVLREPASPVRRGRAEAASKVAEAGDDSSPFRHETEITPPLY
jgi:antitoxin MazE